MAVLVTGAFGFLGKYVVRELVRSGIPVVGVDLNIPRDAILESGAEYTQCDVRDLRRLLRICSDFDVDRVIHLASLLAPASQADPYTSTEVNVLGTQNIFEAAVQLELKNVTWASSQAVFGHVVGDGDSILTENTPHHPDNAYGWAKSYSEGVSKQYRSRYNVNLIGLRIAMLYGAGKERGEGKFTEQLFDRPAIGLEGAVPFGDDSFCWQYVEDVAAAFVRTVQLDASPQPIYSIPGRLASIAEAVEIVRSLVPGVSVETEPGVLGFPFNFSDEAFYGLVGADYEMVSLRDGIEATLTSIAKVSSEKAVRA
ncbi:MAG: NAD-dependent epimerase/dehydratase family protein [Microbacteriaceae bacterium]